VTVESAIRDRLAADAGVAALVGPRVYALKLPQDVTLPAIRVQLIDEPRPYHLRGADALTIARVQTDAYAADVSGVDAYAVAERVADAVDAALSGAKVDAGTPPARHVAGAFRLSRRAIFEPGAVREVRILQDYSVVSSPID